MAYSGSNNNDTFASQDVCNCMLGQSNLTLTSGRLCLSTKPHACDVKNLVYFYMYACFGCAYKHVGLRSLKIRDTHVDIARCFLLSSSTAVGGCCSHARNTITFPSPPLS
eukprot:TRINITY_DN11405_c1_g3_i1.p2 TRINITY_DN11405_c1_g3~~TRINITY_DN11405_c1_g3_i1.p2  ORF type:complete len:110 (+),score=3.26 TRINITY_DN11405_c1_g3_i1:886-1215(+)